jgi:hypothetical protein
VKTREEVCRESGDDIETRIAVAVAMSARCHAMLRRHGAASMSEGTFSPGGGGGGGAPVLRQFC